MTEINFNYKELSIDIDDNMYNRARNRRGTSVVGLQLNQNNNIWPWIQYICACGELYI